MHPLRAPFALLAMTFVTTVLATPINVHVRRDNVTADLVTAMALVDVAIVIANNDISNLFPNPTDPTDSKIQTATNDISTAAERLDDVTLATRAVDPFNNDESETFINNFVAPLFSSIEATAMLSAQQASDISVALSANDTKNFATSIFQMSEAIGLLVNTMRLVLSSDTVDMLNAAIVGPESDLNRVLNLEAFASCECSHDR